MARWSRRWRWIARRWSVAAVPSPLAFGHALHVAAGAEALTGPGDQDATDVVVDLNGGSVRPSADIIAPDMALRASGRFRVRTHAVVEPASRSSVPVSSRVTAISLQPVVRALPP